MAMVWIFRQIFRLPGAPESAFCGPQDTGIWIGIAGLGIPQKEKFELAVVLGKIPKIQGLMSSSST